MQNGMKSKLEQKLILCQLLAKKRFGKGLYKYQIELLKSTAEKRLVAKARQLGMTTAVALEALANCYLNENFTVLVLSTDRDKASDFLSEVRTFLKLIDGWEKLLGETDKATEISFDNGSRIISLPTANTEAGRGYTADLLILDEFGSMAKSVDTGELFDSLVDTTARGGTIHVQGTPAGKDNLFYQMWISSTEFEKFEFPWWLCPDYREPYNGVEDADQSYDPERKWQLNPSRLSSKRMRDQTHPGRWGQENLVSWDVLDGSYWTWGELEELTDSSYEGQGFRVGGVDPAKLHDKSAVVIADVVGGVKRVIYTEDLSGLSLEEQAHKVKALSDKFTVTKWVVDNGGGWGETFIHHLTRLGIRPVPFNFTKKRKQELASRIRSDSNTNKLRIIQSKESDQLKRDMLSYDDNSPTFERTKKEGHGDFISALFLVYSEFLRGQGTVGVTKFNPRATFRRQNTIFHS